MSKEREYQREWLILGIDPGNTGAAALLRVAWPTGHDIDLVRPLLVDVVGFAGAEDRWRPYDVGRLLEQTDLVVLERQQASPNMGVGSAFRLGRNYGRIEGALGAATCEVIVPIPVHWRGAFGLGGGEEGKIAGLKLVRLLLDMPDARLKGHDEADAVLLAWWGWRNVLLPRVLASLPEGDGVPEAWKG